MRLTLIPTYMSAHSTLYRNSSHITPVSEMTYTVSSGTLNSTIPYHIPYHHTLPINKEGHTRSSSSCLVQFIIWACIVFDVYAAPIVNDVPSHRHSLPYIHSVLISTHFSSLPSVRPTLFIVPQRAQHIERDTDLAILSVCPSVTLSYCISKRMNTPSNFFHHLVRAPP